MRSFDGCTCCFHRKKEKNNKPIFDNEGKLIPEEFIIAGDYLITKCQKWNWCSSKNEFTVKYLPCDKQYLKSTFYSYQRISDFLRKNDNIKESMVFDGCVYFDNKSIPKEEIKENVEEENDDDFIIDDDEDDGGDNNNIDILKKNLYNYYYLRFVLLCSKNLVYGI